MISHISSSVHFMPLMDMASASNDSNSNQKDKIIDINEISEQNNNYSTKNENYTSSEEGNNYLPTNDNTNIISGDDNIYTQTLNKTKEINKILPPRKSFIQKPLSFKVPKKRRSQRLDYNSAGVRATSPLFFSGDSSNNLVLCEVYY